MALVRFVRTTHINGRPQSFSKEARQFWKEHGFIVGEVMRNESALSFAEIVQASQEYALDYPESGLILPLEENHIAWCLVRLLEYGMVELNANNENIT